MDKYRMYAVCDTCGKRMSIVWHGGTPHVYTDICPVCGSATKHGNHFGRQNVTYKSMRPIGRIWWNPWTWKKPVEWETAESYKVEY
jgi:hypothetical protein